MGKHNVKERDLRLPLLQAAWKRLKDQQSKITSTTDLGAIMHGACGLGLETNDFNLLVSTLILMGHQLKKSKIKKKNSYYSVFIGVIFTG